MFVGVEVEVADRLGEADGVCLLVLRAAVPCHFVSCDCPRRRRPVSCFVVVAGDNVSVAACSF